jgi:hypothetical protein
MRPLERVEPWNLVSGRQYLIEYDGPSGPVSYPKFKGTFVKNRLPDSPYKCIMSHFRDIVYDTELCSQFQLTLQHCYYRYYEANAIHRYYTNKVLQHITGDPDFQICE